VDLVTEVIPAADVSAYGLSLTQRHVTLDRNSWASSAAATLVPNNGMFLLTSNVYQYVNCCRVIVIIIITKMIFMVLSSWQTHCESSPGSCDEC